MERPDRIQLKESQTAALRLQKEKLTETQKFFNDQLDRVKEAWAELFTVIRKEVGITKEESQNWKITPQLDAFVYEPPPREKEGK